MFDNQTLSPNLHELIARLVEVVSHKKPLTEFPALVEEVGEYAKELFEGNVARQAEELADVWLGTTVMLKAFYPEFNPDEYLETQAAKWLAHEGKAEPAGDCVYVLAYVSRFEPDGRVADYAGVGGPTPQLFELYATEPKLPPAPYRAVSILRFVGETTDEIYRWSRKNSKWTKIKPKESHDLN